MGRQGGVCESPALPGRSSVILWSVGNVITIFHDREDHQSSVDQVDVLAFAKEDGEHDRKVFLSGFSL